MNSQMKRYTGYVEWITRAWVIPPRLWLPLSRRSSNRLGHLFSHMLSPAGPCSLLLELLVEHFNPNSLCSPCPFSIPSEPHKVPPVNLLRNFSSELSETASLNCKTPNKLLSVMSVISDSYTHLYHFPNIQQMCLNT